jgi:hypothetical protein
MHPRNVGQFLLDYIRHQIPVHRTSVTLHCIQFHDCPLRTGSCENLKSHQEINCCGWRKKLGKKMNMVENNYQYFGSRCILQYVSPKRRYLPTIHTVSQPRRPTLTTSLPSESRKLSDLLAVKPHPSRDADADKGRDPQQLPLTDIPEVSFCNMEPCSRRRGETTSLNCDQ